MIWERIFSDPELEVWQLGNWQHSISRRCGTTWYWAPQKQCTSLKVCQSHPKPIDFEGNTCPVCLIEAERNTARKVHR